MQYANELLDRAVEEYETAERFKKEGDADSASVHANASEMLFAAALTAETCPRADHRAFACVANALFDLPAYQAESFALAA